MTTGAPIPGCGLGRPGLPFLHTLAMTVVTIVRTAPASRGDAFPAREQQVPGPDQRRRERVHAGIGRMRPRSCPAARQEAIMAAASVRTGTPVGPARRGRARSSSWKMIRPAISRAARS